MNTGFLKKYFNKVKFDFFTFRKALNRGAGTKYLYYRYVKAPQILSCKKPLEQPNTTDALTIFMLLSKSDFVMGIWALASFYSVSSIRGQLVVQSDGSLTRKQRTHLKQLFPSVRIVEPEEAEEAIRSSDLPKGIKEYRLCTPVVFLKKLVDTYVLSETPYRLIVDSDLVWMGDPKDIAESVHKEKRDSFMMSSEVICRVPFKNGEELDESLAKYNGGIIFFHKDNLDLEKLDTFFNRLDMSKRQRFIGQSGHAYSLANLKPLDMHRYFISGVKPSNKMVVRHYTSPKRQRFYTDGIPVVADHILGKC